MYYATIGQKGVTLVETEDENIGHPTAREAVEALQRGKLAVMAYLTGELSRAEVEHHLIVTYLKEKP